MNHALVCFRHTDYPVNTAGTLVHLKVSLCFKCLATGILNYFNFSESLIPPLNSLLLHTVAVLPTCVFILSLGKVSVETHNITGKWALGTLQSNLAALWAGESCSRWKLITSSHPLKGSTVNCTLSALNWQTLKITVVPLKSPQEEGWSLSVMVWFATSCSLVKGFTRETGRGCFCFKTQCSYSYQSR